MSCGSIANAQLPNEKFGKPSNLEWDYIGWGPANHESHYSTDCYQTCGVYFSQSPSPGSGCTSASLKPDGAKHANIDITYFNADNDITFYHDELSDMKIKVFTKNEKGKVVKRNVDCRSFATERIDDNYVVMHVVVPDVQEGSIIEYQYKITSVRPAYIYDWSFQECIPTVRSACDIEIPAFLQFKMNVPINKLVKPSVEVGHLSYDVNRTDMKKAKTCVSNHYKIFGDNILPKGHALKHNQDGANGQNDTAEEIAIFTSQLVSPEVTPPASIPAGHTHLKIK